MDGNSALTPEVAAKVEALETQLRANPAAKALYLQLAQLHADNGQKALAIEALQRCLKVDPGNALVQHRLNLLTHGGVASATAGLHKPTARFVPRVAAPGRRVPLWAWVAGGLTLVAAGVAAKMVFFPGTRLVVADALDARNARWSPRGDRIAFLSGGPESARLAVHDLESGTTETFEHRASDLAWAPDGMRIAYTGTGAGEDEWRQTVHVLDLGSKKTTPLVAGSNPAWSADGGSLALVCEGTYGEYEDAGEGMPPTLLRAGTPPGLCVVDVADGRVRSRPAGVAQALSFAPQHPTLAYEGWSEEELDAPSSDAATAPTERADDELQSLADAAIAGQARNAYEGSRDLNRELEARQYDRRKKGPPVPGAQFYGTDVFAVGADGSSHVRLTQGGRAGAPQWTADGRILFGQDGASGTQIMTVNPDGSGLRPLLPAPLAVANAASAALSRDRQRLVYVAPVGVANEGLARVLSGEESADLHVVDVAKGKARRLENRHPFKQRFALAPDGRRIVYEVRNGTSGKSELWVMSF
jgi:hypothetical protein